MSSTGAGVGCLDTLTRWVKQDAMRWRGAEGLAKSQPSRRRWTRWAGACTCAGTKTSGHATDMAYPLKSVGQLYRDRAVAENAFDELKNLWGLGGFTTHDINPARP